MALHYSQARAGLPSCTTYTIHLSTIKPSTEPMASHTPTHTLWLAASQPSLGPFIYNPFAKTGQGAALPNPGELCWVCGEKAGVEIELWNPTSVEWQVGPVQGCHVDLLTCCFAILVWMTSRDSCPQPVVQFRAPARILAGTWLLVCVYANCFWKLWPVQAVCLSCPCMLVV